MSGIYIKNMEMPKGVRPCLFASMDKNWKMVCIVGGKHQWHKDRRCDDCPIIEVPKHGRLIDADALIERLEKVTKLKPYLESGINVAEAFVYSTPTIIPEDKEE